ncbi:MAG: hypothetical protein HY208_02265 [Nitrospirae bacterium]|nr:hypothetical protein [Nitrospirota bacterium]
MEQDELLRYAIRALNEPGISYLIGGSLASSAYGEPRLTNDIDLVADLRPSQVPGLLAKFPMDAFHLDGEAVKDAINRKGQFNIIHPSSGYKVDVFVARQDDFSRSQFARRRTLRLPDGEEAFFVSPEDVILNKLIYWKMRQSERQLNDILGMLRVQGDRVDRAYIQGWAIRLDLAEAWKIVLRKSVESAPDR